jgi:hypothetical protein
LECARDPRFSHDKVIRHALEQEQRAVGADMAAIAALPDHQRNGLLDKIDIWIEAVSIPAKPPDGAAPTPRKPRPNDH